MNTFSPKNVIMNARRESEPGRNTEVKLKSSFYKPYDMTLNEHVEWALNKPKFGIDLYKPEDSLLKNQVPGRAFKQQKFKRETFMVSVPKLTQIVPGPDKYVTSYDWTKKHPEHTQQIVKGPVNSFIKQIERKNKSPEKSTPAPHIYQKEQAWLKNSKAERTKGTQKFGEDRTTFIHVQETHANDTPGPIYPLANPVSTSQILNTMLLDYP